MTDVIIDLMCGAGGCAKGYQNAGFNVVGVDIVSQPYYCGDEFIQADALDFVSSGRWKDWDPVAFHASPPCQRWTRMQRQQKNSSSHPDLVTPLRPLLQETGLPYVIENVQNCDALINPVLLCGSMFDMDIQLHRMFEANWPLQHPEWPCRHKIHAPHRFPGTINGSGKRPGNSVVNPMAAGTSHDLWAWAKGIDWIPSEGRFRPNQTLNDAVPPRYTQFIGEQLMTHLKVTA